MNTSHRPIEEIEAELIAAKQAAAAEDKARRESVVPVWKYTLAPHADMFREVWDDTVTQVRLTGTMVNSDEYVAAGNQRPDEGGMTYLFNGASGRIIGAFGGGRVHVADRTWGRNMADQQTVTESAKQCCAELSEFIVSHPEGGDVTSIIEAHNQRIGRI